MLLFSKYDAYVLVLMTFPTDASARRRGTFLPRARSIMSVLLLSVVVCKMPHLAYFNRSCCRYLSLFRLRPPLSQDFGLHESLACTELLVPTLLSNVFISFATVSAPWPTLSCRPHLSR